MYSKGGRWCYCHSKEFYKDKEEEYNDEAVVTLLKLQSYPDNENWPNVNHVDTWDFVSAAGGRKLSNFLMPSVLKKYLTGSRAEGLFTKDSDFDYMYEVGPVEIHNRREHGHWYTESSVPGFYLLMDDQNGLVLPKLFQIKIAPYLLKQTSTIADRKPYFPGEGLVSPIDALSLDDMGAALSKYLSGGEDSVVALKLAYWPEDIKYGFQKRKRKWPDTSIVEEICEGMSPLYGSNLILRCMHKPKLRFLFLLFQNE